jgi:hypothetical protein
VGGLMAEWRLGDEVAILSKLCRASIQFAAPKVTVLP